MPHNFLELIGSVVAAAPSDPHAIYLNQLPIHMQIAEETVKYGGSSRGSLDAPPQNGGTHNFCLRSDLPRGATAFHPGGDPAIDVEGGHGRSAAILCESSALG